MGLTVWFSRDVSFSSRASETMADTCAGSVASCCGYRTVSPDSRCIHKVYQGLLFWLFKGGIKVSRGTVLWYKSSHGTDFEIPDTVFYILDTIYYLRSTI